MAKHLGRMADGRTVKRFTSIQKNKVETEEALGKKGTRLIAYTSDMKNRRTDEQEKKRTRE
jgi:hypothetical protein